MDLVPSIRDLSFLIRFMGFLIELIPTSILMIALFSLAKLFKLYSEFSFFTMNHVKYFHRIGIALLCNQLIMPFCDTLMTFVITFMNSPKDRIIVLAFTSANLTWITLSLGILLISWIMKIGYDLQEEQIHTV